MTKGEIKQLCQDYPGVLHKLGLSLTNHDDDDEEMEVNIDEINAMIQEIEFKELSQWDEMHSKDETILDDFEEEDTCINDSDWEGALAILNEEGF